MLELESVSVQYGLHRALSDVSFSVNCGEVVGVVGPNGAGKTTLFKVLARVIERHDGSATFMKTPLIELPSSTIGYLAESPFQFEFFTPVEMLLFERALRFLDISEDEILGILHTLNLDTQLQKPLRTLSQGLRKRVAIASAFLGTPEIVILDEPLNSLDIQSVIALKRLILDAQSRGAIVLISSHVLDFFDGLTTRTVFLNKGSVFYSLDNDSRKSEELYAELFMTD